MENMNGRIEPAAQRISENELCIKMLRMIGEAAPPLKYAAERRGSH